MGNMVGVQQGLSSNTSVYVIFTGPSGWPISPGFTVSDGTYQYAVQDGGIIGTGGTTLPLFCLATVGGIWPVPANTVQTVATSLPPSITITVTNPQPGTPGSGPESEVDYRQQVLEAWKAPATAFQSTLKTNLAK
jgi:hypothetical protein